MKHLEPLMTYLSPRRTAVVRMPETSEPASGSVRQKDASVYCSLSMPRYFFLISSGQVPSRSNSQATARISFSAKSCAISRSAFCSSVSVKSTTIRLSRLTGQSTADQRVLTLVGTGNNEPSERAGATIWPDGERVRDRAVRGGRRGGGGGGVGAGHQRRLVRPDRRRPDVARPPGDAGRARVR